VSRNADMWSSLVNTGTEASSFIKYEYSVLVLDLSKKAVKDNRSICEALFR
jgi:hypothetical protein